MTTSKSWCVLATWLVGAVLLGASGAGASRQHSGLPIAFTSDRDGNMEVYAMAADGTHQTRLTSNPAEDRDPVWSPDGQWIAFISRRDSKETEIFRMRADGREQTRLTTTPGSDFAAAWSPDGKRIAFVSEENFNSEIFVMNADGSGQRNLTKNKAHDVSPSWTSDGKEVVFLSNRDEPRRTEDSGEVYLANVETGVQRAVTQKQLALLPSWVPGRDQVLFFVSQRGKGTFLRLVAPSGGEPTTIPGGGSDTMPLGSPRGSYIAFQSSRHGGPPAAVYVTRADGSGVVRVSPGPEPVLGPSGWSPDERQVLYAAFQNNNWDIHAASADGKADRRLTNNTHSDMGAVWSPATK